MSVNLNSNRERAEVAWGIDMPRWVMLLADAADRTSQRAVADRIDRSSGYVSRLINRNYAGSYEEAETIIRAAFGEEMVDCPVTGMPIPLQACVRNRRRTQPTQNWFHLRLKRTCPDCPSNTDSEGD